jgi:hypothetical protein
VVGTAVCAALCAQILHFPVRFPSAESRIGLISPGRACSIERRGAATIRRAPLRNKCAWLCGSSLGLQSVPVVVSGLPLRTPHSQHFPSDSAAACRSLDDHCSVLHTHAGKPRCGVVCGFRSARALILHFSVRFPGAESKIDLRLDGRAPSIARRVPAPDARWLNWRPVHPLNTCREGVLRQVLLFPQLSGR